jgi:serine phosphatase RsbU (regulator of sigma subunit)
LAAVPAAEFLPSASRYLMRQDWSEGFATAIHLHLDTTSGQFTLRKAGHPPAIWLKAGSGQWEVIESEGPVLGLVEGGDYEAVHGVLRSGDALMLYTDGLVERTERDIDSGIDKLAGRGQLLQARGFSGGAATVMDQVGMDNDDRALVLVHRI